MDRKEIIGAVFAVIGLISWTIYSTSQTAKLAHAQQEAAQAAAQEAAAAAAAAPAPEPVATPATPASPAAPTATPDAKTPEEAAPAEQIEKLATSSVEYSFTNLGGGIARALLFHHTAEKAGSNVDLKEFGAIP